MADVLGAFEQAVLLAVLRLEDEAYGRAILKEVQTRLDRDVAAGAVHATLERLVRKRLVGSRLGSGTPVRRPGPTLLPAAAQRAARPQQRPRRHRQSVARPQLAAEGIRMNPTPPLWAEEVLQVILKPGDFTSVSGDLLEEYRDTVHPSRGQSAADAWYVRQVSGFVWRSVRVWAV